MDKTAMQELVEWASKTTLDEHLFGAKNFIMKATELLEKERNQIEVAYNQGDAMINPKEKKEIRFDCLKDGSLHTGISIKAINNALRGRAKTAGGFIWQYQ